MRKADFANAKTTAQISFAVTELVGTLEGSFLVTDQNSLIFYNDLALC